MKFCKIKIVSVLCHDVSAKISVQIHVVEWQFCVRSTKQTLFFKINLTLKLVKYFVHKVMAENFLPSTSQILCTVQFCHSWFGNLNKSVSCEKSYGVVCSSRTLKWNICCLTINYLSIILKFKMSKSFQSSSLNCAEPKNALYII